MTFKNLSIPKLCIFLLSSILPLLSIADRNATSIVSLETICHFTTNPSYCKNVLSNKNGNIFDYARISVQKSLSQSLNFLNLVNSYLQDRSSLSQRTIRALEDCQFFAKLSSDYLSNTIDIIDKPSNILPTSQVENVHTMLSAVLTNQETCLDGLQTTASDERVKNDLSSSLYDDTKLHSVSLDLFVKGWVLEKKVETTWQHNERHLGLQNGHLPLKMLHTIYDYARGHKVDDNTNAMISSMVIVSQDGSGNFTTIKDAISAAPNNTLAGNGYFVIFITAGLYKEYVSIPVNKKYLMIVGDGIGRTIITGNHNAVDGFTTFRSSTFVVAGEGFIAVDMTIRNTAGPTKGQAVAVSNVANLSIFYKCSIEGYQDTLFAHTNKQFYRECDIYGTIDFIFGNAIVVFQSCNIYVRLPVRGQFNVITAQGRTHPQQVSGISIHNATIKANHDLAPKVGVVKTYLGRPWKEYARTVYLQSFMDNLIDHEGWHKWSRNFSIEAYYFGEYGNRGPGSDTTMRVKWPTCHIMDATDAANFTVSNFLGGGDWLRQSGIPYIGGLIYSNKVTS